MRDILKEIDRIYKTVVEEGLDPEVADGETELALEKAFQRVVKERMSEALIGKWPALPCKPCGFSPQGFLMCMGLAIEDRPFSFQNLEKGCV